MRGELYDDLSGSCASFIIIHRLRALAAMEKRALFDPTAKTAGS